MTEKMLTRQEAAKILGIKPNTFNLWRSQGKPHPIYYKINGVVRFKESDLNSFIESNRIGGQK